MLAILVVLLGVQSYGQAQQQEQMKSLITLIMPRADAAGDVAMAYLQQAVAVRNYLLSGQDRFLGDYHRTVEISREAIAHLEQVPRRPEGDRLFAEIKALGVRYTEATDRAVAARQQGVTGPALDGIEAEMAEAREQLLDRTQAFITLQLRFRNEAVEEIYRVQSEAARSSIALFVGALLLATLMAYYTAGSVRDPVQRLLLASRALAGGDFHSGIKQAEAVVGRRSPESSRDEVCELAAAFRAMAQELMHREKRLAAQAKLSSVLASTSDPAHMGTEALREIAGYAGLEFGLIYAQDSRAPSLRRIGSYAMNGSLDTIHIGEGIPGEAAASQRRVVVRDIPSDTPFQVDFGFDRVPPRAMVAQPMVSRGELVGTLLVGTVRDLNDDALEFVETSAQQLAVSLQNALAHQQVERLAEELQLKNETLVVQNEEIQAQSEEIQAQNEEIQAQNEELQAQNEELQAQGQQLSERSRELAHQVERVAQLQAVTTRLSASLSSDEILEGVARAAHDLLEASLASVLLLDEPHRQLEVMAAVGTGDALRHGLRIDLDDSLAGRAMVERTTLSIDDVSRTPIVGVHAMAASETTGAMAAAPMLAADEALGALEVYFPVSRQLSEDEIGLLSALAAAAAVAVRNARMFQEMQEQKQWLQGVVEQIPEAVFVVDRSGETVVCNAAASHLFGIRESQLLELVPRGNGDMGGEGAPAEMWLPTLAALAGERVLAREVCCGADAGHPRYAQVSSVPIFDNGMVTGVVTVAVDISRLKEVDRVKDEFLSFAAHELKSPLTSVRGFAQLLQKRMTRDRVDDSVERMVVTIVDQVDRVVRLVDRLLNLSRAQMGRLEVKAEPVDLVELAREQLRTAQIRTDRHRLVLEAPEELAGAWDRAYLEQVLSNLLDNAIRYSPQGGEIRVSLRLEGGLARLLVSDQGIGIRQEDLDRVFNRHFRSSEARMLRSDGMGIGLYLTREIVAAHGGRMWVESRVGEGTSFAIELPRQRAQLATQES